MSDCADAVTHYDWAGKIDARIVELLLESQTEGKDVSLSKNFWSELRRGAGRIPSARTHTPPIHD